MSNSSCGLAIDHLGYLAVGLCLPVGNRKQFLPNTALELCSLRIESWHVIVGVTTPTTLVSTKPSTFLDPTGTYRAYDFMAGERGAALYRAVQDAVNEAARHADYTIVLGHLGISPDCADYMSTDVIAHTTNFVALVDGHSHSEYTGSRVRNAAGKFFKSPKICVSVINLS